MDQAFLRKVQNQGWHIEAVDLRSVVARCPVNGCDVRLKFSPVAPVPQACTEPARPREVILEGYETARRELRRRRLTLGLVIEEVELTAGLSLSHIGKMEKENPSKIPNLETFVVWAGTLGYDVIIRPRSIPLQTVKVISETRGVPVQNRRAAALGYMGPKTKVLPPPEK
jgi:transcriptional regulator with XRE-family HTH domain